VAQRRRAVGRSALALCPLLTVVLAGSALAAPRQLAYGDGVPEGKLAYGGGGHLVTFDAGAEGCWVTKLEVLGARYGQGDPGGREFRVAFLDLDGQTIARIALPWSLWERGECYWRDIPVPPIRVPARFAVGIDSGSDPDDGIHVGYDGVTQSHSYSCVTGALPRGLGNRDWMIWVTLDDAPPDLPPFDDLMVLADGQAFLDTVLGIDADSGAIRSAAHGAIPQASVLEVRPHAIERPTEPSVTITQTDGTKRTGVLRSMDGDAVRIQDFAGAERTISRADVRAVTIARSAPIAIPAQAPVTPPNPDGTITAPTERRSWAPEQATGQPDTPEGGDRATAWAPLSPDAGAEWLELGYPDEVNVSEVRIWETCGPGAVTKVVAVGADGAEVALWEGDDPTTEAPGEFVVQGAEPVQTRCVRIYLDTSHEPGWNEIDAVELVGADGARQWATEATASSSYADRGVQQPTFEWLQVPDGMRGGGVDGGMWGGAVGPITEVGPVERAMRW